MENSTRRAREWGVPVHACTHSLVCAMLRGTEPLSALLLGTIGVLASIHKKGDRGPS